MAVEVRDTGWVDSRRMFYGFYQRDAYRTNGDRVWVTGDYRWEVDEVRRWLMKEARRANLRMIQIAEMADLAEGPNEEEDYLSALATAEVVVECDPVGELHRRLSVIETGQLAARPRAAADGADRGHRQGRRQFPMDH